MRLRKSFLFALMAGTVQVSAQTGMKSSNPVAEKILLGQYDPNDYKAGTIINTHDAIAKGLQADISADSLKKTIEKLITFRNRNSASDTVSETQGFGAARRWVYSSFQGYSQRNENRLIPSYLEFTMDMCGVKQHKNIFAVLPGTDVNDKSVIIIEGHMDSRCEVLCDTACLAEGAEDNASGTALVMELARVMSKYTFRNTIVFLVTTGEEQGLAGATAFANYCFDKGIKVKALFNNDVVGGIICGKTSSPPSCSGEGEIDSTHVRLFSSGGFNSVHKGLARFVKLEYQEELRPYVKVPMSISIMTPEDRTGRGGDHIPFRQRGYASIRFTSANEHGDANPVADYTDRQHSTRDILGKDINNDGKIDSYYVSFTYLARNTAINGNGAAMAALGPKTPTVSISNLGQNRMKIDITSAENYPAYKLGVRTTGNDFDTLITLTSKSQEVVLPFASKNYLSVASVDAQGVESLFSGESLQSGTGIEEEKPEDKTIELLQNRPNPFDEATTIGVMVNSAIRYKTAVIQITDMAGRVVESLPITLSSGLNEVNYVHGYHKTGMYNYSLVIDGKTVLSKQMVFAN